MSDNRHTPDPADIPSILKDAGMQVTAQRVAVYRAVLQSPHAAADEIALTVRQELGAISRQAVFDSLNAMSECGILRRIQPAGSAARYEHRVNNHHHLACRSCGNVTDIDCVVGQAPCLTPDKDHGYEIDEAEVTFWGLCPTCQLSK